MPTILVNYLADWRFPALSFLPLFGRNDRITMLLRKLGFLAEVAGRDFDENRCGFRHSYAFL